jgi:hypothetical protein
MLCISCGAEMRIARIEQDAAMKASGYEHRKLECVSCGKTERRLAFSGDSAIWPIEYRWALASLSSAAKQPNRARKIIPPVRFASNSNRDQKGVPFAR